MSPSLLTVSIAVTVANTIVFIRSQIEFSRWKRNFHERLDREERIQSAILRKLNVEVI